MANILDTNTFIEGKNVYYRFAVCPGYWEWLLRENAQGNVFSIDKVQSELTDGHDDLAAWAAAQTAAFFLPVDTQTTSVAGQLSMWVTTRSYSQSAVAAFLNSTDYWLVAYALAHGHTVVTREVSSPDSKKRVLIPDACLAVGVPCKSPFDLLSELGAVFVLQ